MRPKSANLGIAGICQERPWRFIEEIELAIVRETKATIANVRITTTTANSLLGRVMEGQGNFQTQTTCYQLDALGGGKILSPGQDKCRAKRTFLQL